MAATRWTKNYGVDKMAIRRINIISFTGLVFLFLSGYGRISYDIHLILTCVLLVIFTSATILDFLLIKQWNEIRILPLVLVTILGLVMGYLTSTTVGSQRHDEHDGGPSLGMATWPFVLDIIYPFCFLIFMLCLSYLRSRVIQLGILFAWIIAAIVIGYFFGDYYSWAKDPKNAHEFYNYFPSETRVVTPLLIGTVLFWTLWISVKYIVEKTRSANNVPKH